MEIIGARG